MAGVGFLADAPKALLKCGVPHAAELKPLWAMGASGYDSADQNMTATMQRFWSNFAHYGNPNGPDGAGVAGVVWPRYGQRTEYAYLDLGVPSVAKRDLRRGHCDLWSSLNPTWPQKPVPSQLQ